jgi:hypothetical protein
MFDGLDADCRGCVALARSGTADQNDILGRFDMNRPLFAGDPELRILGYGKEELWKEISRRAACASGSDGFGSRERIRKQICGNLVDFAEGWMQQGQSAHLGEAA